MSSIPSVPQTSDAAPLQLDTLINSLRDDRKLHEGKLLAMQRGISASDANVLEHSPVMVRNLFRFFFMNNELAHFFTEHGFALDYKGAQTSFVKYCEIDRISVTVILMRGYRQKFEEMEVFAVNPKSDSLAFRVAENYIDSKPLGTLFPMEELIEKNIIKLKNYDKSLGNTTLILFWQPSDQDEVFADEKINVYLARPMSIDENKSLIQCEWVQPIGAFNPVSSGDIDIIPIDLPTAPAYEPSIVPRSEGENGSI